MVAYLRHRSLQQKILNSMLAHLDYTAFKTLGLSMEIYNSRLQREMEVLDHKKRSQVSPHKVIRI